MTVMTIDCEFNGFEGELISLALVSDDGQEFYEVVEHKEPTAEWVEENVIPYLDKEPVSMFMFQHLLEQFLSQYDEVHIIADWPSDLEHLCSVLIVGPGLRMNLPERFSMEICTWLDAESKIPHNALWDARANMEAWLEHQLETQHEF